MSIPADDNPQQRLAYDRTLLANERTYAAWLRTGLAVAAFGFALVHLPDRPTPLERVLAAALVFAGAAVIAYGGFRYRQVARDLRAESTPSAVASPAVITAFTALVAILIVALLFLL
jgi:putative membrane protein